MILKLDRCHKFNIYPQKHNGFLTNMMLASCGQPNPWNTEVLVLSSIVDQGTGIWSDLEGITLPLKT